MLKAHWLSVVHQSLGSRLLHASAGRCASSIALGNGVVSLIKHYFGERWFGHLPGAAGVGN